MTIKDTAILFVNQLGENIGPILHKHCSKSQHYPNYQGLTLNQTFPISKMDEKIWYTFRIELNWEGSFLGMPSSITQSLLVFYIPINKTREAFFWFIKPRLRPNISSFVYKKTTTLFEQLSKTEGWVMKMKTQQEIDVIYKKENRLFTTEEAEKIIKMTAK